MRIVGIILLIIGIIATIAFGVDVANDSETWNFLGMEFGVSKANWTPLIISAIVLVVGIIITASSKKSKA